MPPAVRLTVHGVALVVGAAAGVLGSFVHAYTFHGLPVGLLVALALSLAVFATGGLAAGARSGALAAAAGWLVAVAYLSLQRPEGDLVVPASTLGYCWLFGGTLVAGAALAFPYALWSAADQNRPGSQSSGTRPFGR
ncbi:MAG: DUF6113 family protein [Actinomycetes bacterium]